MKSFVLSLTAIIALSATVWGAPVTSVPSPLANPDRAIVDAYLKQPMVAQHLTTLGLPPAEIEAALHGLSATDLAALAADIELLQAGGTMQGGNPHPWGVLECIFAPLGRLFYNAYQVIFCWGTLK